MVICTVSASAARKSNSSWIFVDHSSTTNRLHCLSCRILRSFITLLRCWRFAAAIGLKFRLQSASVRSNKHRPRWMNSYRSICRPWKQKSSHENVLSISNANVDDSKVVWISLRRCTTIDPLNEKLHEISNGSTRALPVYFNQVKANIWLNWGVKKVEGGRRGSANDYLSQRRHRRFQRCRLDLLP